MGKTIETVENQKIVIVSKESADKEHPYSVINLEAFDVAAASLTTIGSYKLWTYLAKNQNKYKFALSRTDFCRWASVSKNTYLRAVSDLEDKGFLVAQSDTSNTYTFYELPKKGSIITSEDKNILIPQKKVAESTEFQF